MLTKKDAAIVLGRMDLQRLQAAVHGFVTQAQNLTETVTNHRWHPGWGRAPDTS